MTLIYESLKKIISNPVFYFISIGLGLVFTAIFSYFNPEKATWISALIFLSVIILSLVVAFVLMAKQDITAVARYMSESGKHKYALKILIKARKTTTDHAYRLKINYEIGSVHFSMEQYQQTVSILMQILEFDDTEWTWKVYLLLAKALCHTKGYYTKEALDAYLTCIEYRKKYDEYGKEDIKLDSDLCHEVSEIYRVKKDYAASNKWFREEMLLRDAGCDIVIKNRINDLSAKAAMIANESHTEDALRLYEELAHLIEINISDECDKYAMVQLQMGSLFMNGYTTPRYDLAVECFQKFVEIKRKYMQDLPEDLSHSFSRILPEMQKLCRKSIDDIVKLFQTFMRARNSTDGQDPNLVELRDAIIDKCDALLPLFEEVFSADSLELAEVYRLLGESYKWYPTNLGDCSKALLYLEEVEKIWKKYKHDQTIQTELAHLLVDMGGTYIMQRDYERALPYRLEALKVIKQIENPDLERVAKIEVALMKAYAETRQSRTVSYNRYLEEHGLSTVIESVQEQPLGNGWCNVKVKIKGLKEECNWKLTQ